MIGVAFSSEEAPGLGFGLGVWGGRSPSPCSVVVSPVEFGSVQTCASSGIVPVATKDQIRSSSGPIRGGNIENLLFGFISTIYNNVGEDSYPSFRLKM